MTKLSKEEILKLKKLYHSDLHAQNSVEKLIAHIEALEAEKLVMYSAYGNGKWERKAMEYFNAGLKIEQELESLKIERDRLASRVERLRAALTELSKPFLQNLEMTIILEDAKRAIAEDDKDAG